MYPSEASIDLPEPPPAPSDAGSIRLSIVVPTFNEAGNVEILFERLAAVLPRDGWEVVFVDDDSRDGTGAVLRRMAQCDGRVRSIQRVGRRGLSSACIEGILSTSSPFVAVMDADGQHDEACLPRMLAALETGRYDVAVGSRYTAGGSLGDWDASRAWISRATTALGRQLIKVGLTDPMSGFFALRRDFFDATVRELAGDGFKILLDLFASASRPVRFVEIPYRFRSRVRGESKLDARVALDFVRLILAKTVGRYIPVEFVFFAAIGGTGVGVHLLVLGIHIQWLGTGFPYSQFAATLIAMLFNYTLNNEITYRDRRLRGLRFVTGFASFAAICSVGMATNLFIATTLFSTHVKWIVAGIAGALAGAVWNYAMSSALTWRRAS